MELNHCWKESLMENYISFHIFNQISQELNLQKFRQCKIPNISSIKTSFYSSELKPNEFENTSRIKKIEIEEPPREETSKKSPASSILPSQTISVPPATATPLPIQWVPKITFSETASVSTSTTLISSNHNGRVVELQGWRF